MIDGCGRAIDYLRISVTDRCNLRCTYCMPEGGIEWLPHEAILTYEEIVRLCKIFAGLGIKKVRLTGGEPLVRRGLSSMVAGIKSIDGIESVTLTTNGVLLAEQLPDLLDAGLNGVNISLDTLDRQQYATIARRDGLEDTLRGLHAAIAVSDRLNVKVNCVPSGANDDQLVPLAGLAKDNNIAMRFIEMMPIGLGDERPCRTQEDVTAMLSAVYGAPKTFAHTIGAGPGQYITFDGFVGKIGFISAMTHKFCSDCNRVRLTATGFLKTCLQYDRGVELKPLLMAYEEDDVIRATIEHAIRNKPTAHHFSEGREQNDDSRKMYQIGG